ncbi:MAG: DNA mismatch repair protein MutS [Verrucomicrobia bacterium]|nr:DNA mismatch repair protein MutS [Verrucomicrobiota bacterium]
MTTPAPTHTPMMQQYRRVKREIPADALLLFRLGDFYEMFFDDAKVSAQILNVTLTHRNHVPMCGIPHHAAESYIGRLLRAGRKVAICDQMEEPRPGVLVKREISQILSPGAHFDGRMLDASRNNYLAALTTDGKRFGFAVVDLTTGDFKLAELDTPETLASELARTRPAEVVAPAAKVSDLSKLLPDTRIVFTGYEDWVFENETAFFALRDHFKTQSLDGFGCAGMTLGIGAAGAAIYYLQNALRRNVAHVRRLQVYQPGEFLVLDTISQRNLELVESLRPDAPKNSTLFGAMNRTVTPMGARLLREWITRPLRNADAVKARQKVVGEFHEAVDVLADFRDQLTEVKDLERILGRLTTGHGNARDLLGLKESLAVLPLLKSILEPLVTPLGVLLRGGIIELPDVCDLIQRAITDEPPLSLNEGGLIRDGFSPELDELRRASKGGKEWIAKLQQDEIGRTGISSLKVRYNQVFGYFIEITKSNLAKVPENYIRKQTIANGERFITPELKEVEGKILGADERASKLERELFEQVRLKVLEQTASIQNTAAALAQLDVLAGFAELARHQNYCCPEVNDEARIEIRDGRHPVVEQLMTEERFVPNDTVMNGSEARVLVITGPNMAGKSTYIRQVALLVLMAQIGSWIPAAKATVGIVDRIFTRVGASDDLVRGQSTFMVEMNETANILNNATAKSLVILDEIGRGTSTFDGLSIAWSVAEHLHNEVKAKTLFATHYHELTELARTCSAVKNYNVAVREWSDQIIFIRKIVEGGTDKSYGIHVARLAGLPRPVIERAKEILRNLEESELTPEGQPKIAQHEHGRGKGKVGKGKGKAAGKPGKVSEPPPQLFLFGDKVK